MLKNNFKNKALNNTNTFSGGKAKLYKRVVQYDDRRAKIGHTKEYLNTSVFFNFDRMTHDDKTEARDINIEVNPDYESIKILTHNYTGLERGNYLTINGAEYVINKIVTINREASVICTRVDEVLDEVNR